MLGKALGLYRIAFDIKDISSTPLESSQIDNWGISNFQNLPEDISKHAE
jgi:hypothetical protein